MNIMCKADDDRKKEYQINENKSGKFSRFFFCRDADSGHLHTCTQYINFVGMSERRRGDVNQAEFI